MKNNNIQIRLAEEMDIGHILQLFAEDDVIANREKLSEPLSDCYVNGFKRIASDPNNELVVVEMDHKIIGTLQITYIPYLLYQGSIRSLIEAVFISSEYRGQGIGTQMMQWAIERTKKRGCKIVQLTSNKKRKQAHRFYKRLGFKATHQGFKFLISCII